MYYNENKMQKVFNKDSSNKSSIGPIFLSILTRKTKVFAEKYSKSYRREIARDWLFQDWSPCPHKGCFYRSTEAKIKAWIKQFGDSLLGCHGLDQISVRIIQGEIFARSSFKAGGLGSTDGRPPAKRRQPSIPLCLKSSRLFLSWSNVLHLYKTDLNCSILHFKSSKPEIVK